MTTLSVPDETAQAHSVAMIAHINKKIAEYGGGCLPFDHYMHEALYAPNIGYYTAGSPKLGSAGDFITAPELSPLFGKTLAAALKPHLQRFPSATILELGPGSGKLAVDILLSLEQQNALPVHYYLLEVSADLKHCQQAYLRVHLSPALFARCQWLEALPACFEGIILANEVLDALAVQIFRIEEHGMSELSLSLTTAQAWRLNFTASTSVELEERVIQLKQRYHLPCGYQSEVNLRQEALLKSLAAILKRGVLLFIDYGFNGFEFYHPERSMGTLQCHYRHHNHSDPLWLPGLQDITSHIDFTALATCGIEAGLALSVYCTQAEFLMQHGILSLSQASNEVALIQQSQALQKLLMPHEMGELFKVMAFHKDCVNPFVAMVDKRHTL